MVIGKAYKDSIIGYFALFLLLIGFFGFGLGASFFIPILWLKIVSVSTCFILITLTFNIPFLAYKNKKQVIDAIIYDEFAEAFTINYHNKSVKILKKDIYRITIHNIGIDDKSIILIGRLEYGKIKFYLKDRKTYKTPCLIDINDVFLKIDTIIYGEEDNPERPIDRYKELESKVNNWGSKKEYPNIVSILVAIFLPLVGLIFVENQAKYKEFKYGKNSLLTIFAITISLVWWLLFIIIIHII